MVVAYSRGVVRWIGSARPPLPEMVADLDANAELISTAATTPVVIFGTIGAGKTVIMLLAEQAQRERGVETLWTDAAEYCDDVFAGYRHAKAFSDWSDRFSAEGIAASVPALFLDDLGAEKNSEPNVDAISKLLHQRYVRRLPTWITTNLRSAEFQDRYGERITSRLRELGGFEILKGSDRRRLVKQ
jgi:DNA replication protein DnaC